MIVRWPPLETMQGSPLEGQNVTKCHGKSLHMKNEFKYFDSFSVVILILILIVLYDIYVLDWYWISILNVYTIL